MSLLSSTQMATFSNGHNVSTEIPLCSSIQSQLYRKFSKHVCRYMHILKLTGCSNIPWAQNQIIAHCSGKRHKVMYSWRSGDMISKPYRQSIRPLTLHRGRHRYVDPTFQPYRRIMTLESLEVEISPQEFFSSHEICRLEDET